LVDPGLRQSVAVLKVGDATSNKARGTATFVYPRPWILLGKIVGHFAEDMVDNYVAGMAKTLDGGRKCFGFHDWSEMTNYDSACRQRLTDWAIQHLDETDSHHVFVRSKLVAMGVSTASLLLGGKVITSYTERTAFERALQDVRKGGATR
jgi:hypothetical protein